MFNLNSKKLLLIVLNGIEINQKLTAHEHLYKLLIVLNGIEIHRTFTTRILTCAFNRTKWN